MEPAAALYYCQDCQETGKCRVCNGRGSVIRQVTKNTTTVFKSIACAECSGTGLCPECRPVYLQEVSPSAGASPPFPR